ncbi:MAG TPA: ribonuclease R [Lactobacillaceae bacterium]|jgi:ribonuclease R
MDQKQLQAQLAGFLKANATQSFSALNLADGLRMNDAAGYKAVENGLNALVRTQQADLTDGNYQFRDEKDGLVGVFHANDKGFGFVSWNPEDKESDIYIGPADTKLAMNNDKVRVIITTPAGNGRGASGRVLDIEEHAYQQVVGVFNVNGENPGYIGEVTITDKKAAGYKLLVKGDGLKPTDGTVVVADVTDYPTAEKPKILTGLVREIVGYKDEPGMDILQIVYANKVPSEFPQAVLDEAAQIPAEVPAADMADRIDLRDQTLVTIDGADTKDIDDAVVAWKLDNGNYHLGVHIADVSHYVQEGTALDEEAYNRGTSVYLTDRVIPMLPRNISNGIASLNPGVDRLAMSAEMEIDKNGHVVSHNIHTSVIRSHARLTYDGVNQLLDDGTFVEPFYEELAPMLQVMSELHEVLVDMRQKRGAIEFDAPEAKIIVDETGKAVDIELRERATAERMIESFMLIANETVAEHFDKLKVPFLYRIHETPDSERVTKFAEFTIAIGHPLKGDPNNMKPSAFQALIRSVEDLPEGQMISTMMLRAMKQAKYSDDPVGHFGIGAEYYTHFTSPIRRYPDLTVHRLIKWYEKNGTGDEAQAKYRDVLAQIGQDTSTRERRAIDTERDVDALKKAEFMEDKVGMEFDGVVNSALKFGLFISLDNTVEGLVHISNLTDDYYEYDESHAALIGRSSHRIFQIGQPVRIKVLRVNKVERTVDFILVNPENGPTTDIRVARKENDRGSFGRQRGRGRDDKNGQNGGRNRGEKRYNDRNGKRNDRTPQGRRNSK